MVYDTSVGNMNESKTVEEVDDNNIQLWTYMEYKGRDAFITFINRQYLVTGFTTRLIQVVTEMTLSQKKTEPDEELVKIKMKKILLS